MWADIRRLTFFRDSAQDRKPSPFLGIARLHDRSGRPKDRPTKGVDDLPMHRYIFGSQIALPDGHFPRFHPANGSCYARKKSGPDKTKG